MATIREWDTLTCTLGFSFFSLPPSHHTIYPFLITRLFLLIKPTKFSSPARKEKSKYVDHLYHLRGRCYSMINRIMYTRPSASLAPKCVIEGHSKIIWSLACLGTSLAVSPDETMVVSGSLDGRLWLWNIKKGRMVGDPWEGHNGQVRCLDWSPNVLEIASGSTDGTIRRWNSDTGR
ncbi:WD40-repeat-containing domain protein [Suillus plorans]|uniref:WD40-repeat-containing domain protein n=1 Tax=Suillus plorans TaxID=116603 RepID=A0A9P7ALK5_9AGAM|nr:WD40-repeat-containing domain protein [Suillus plorans]KAG1791877.1 WD40-repeat-containing domain protein [Suillus plorans]